MSKTLKEEVIFEVVSTALVQTLVVRNGMEATARLLARTRLRLMSVEVVLETYSVELSFDLLSAKYLLNYG